MIEINELREKIIELYDECIENSYQFHRKLDLFQVPDSLALIIKQKTTIDIYGYWVCIDNYGIRHTLEHHGNPISEAKRGQLNIVKEDFVTMIDVCLYPDNIKFSDNAKNNQRYLQFEKEIENKIFIVKEVRTVTSTKKNKINRLMFHTMYKIKATNKN